MELNREKLKRMFEDTKGNGGSANGGGGGGSLAGYATQAWVNEGFVSIDFFNRLFTVYGPGETSSDPDVVIEPNDLDSTIKNIKAMFGLWTEQYLSALGLNPGGTGSATSLSMLDDVDITTPTNGQALVYNATSLKWENQTISTVTALANLTDVLLTSPSTNQVLLYNGSNWVNSSLKTINGNSIIGSGDIQVGGGGGGGGTGYLPLTGGTMTGSIRMNNVSLRDGNGNWLIGKSDNSNGTVSVGSTNITQPVTLNNSRSFFTIGTSGTIEANTTNDGEFYVKINNSDTNWYIFNKTWFGPSGNSAENLNLGRLNYRWGTLYAGGGDFRSTNAGVVAVRRGASTGGALIDYYSNNQTSNLWRVGSSSAYNFIMEYNGTEKFVFLNNASFGIGVSPSYALHVSGSIYATGAITALSDIKQKNIKEYMQLGIDEVADAPIIKFTWKDPKAEDKGLQVGSIAQYWEKVLPEAVKKDKEGTLSMSYGVVALVAAVSTAKKVRELDERVTKLEKIER